MSIEVLSVLLQQPPPSFQGGPLSTDQDLLLLLVGTIMGAVLTSFLRLMEDKVKRDRDRQEAERILQNKYLLKLEHGDMLSEVALEEAAKAMPDEQHRELRRKYDGDLLQRAMAEESRKSEESLNGMGFVGAKRPKRE